MMKQHGVDIAAYRDFLVRDDVHNLGNFVVHFTADIDTLACLYLVAFEVGRTVIGTLPASLLRDVCRAALPDREA